MTEICADTLSVLHVFLKKTIRYISKTIAHALCLRGKLIAGYTEKLI